VGTAFTQIRYGAGSGFLGLFDGPRWRGVNAYFSGGPNTPLSAAAQTVDVSGSAESIDAGRASIGLSGMLGGFSSQDDNVQVTAQYLDAAGGALGTAAAIGPVTAAQRHNITTLLPRSTTAPVPPGTRKIRVTITATRVGGGSYDDGSADNVRLTLAAPGPPAGPAPPPRLALSGLALKPRSFRAARRGASIAKRRPARTGTTITFTLNRAATTTFTVTRKARGVRSGKRCVAPPRKPRRGKKARKCTRTITAGSFKAIGRTGLTTLHFSGRLRGRKLARGGYQLNATAGDSTGRTKPARKAFKIIG
jgi:hypothetical protein